MKVTVGCASMHAGVATNRYAQVVTGEGTAIRGLYAVGTDAMNISDRLILASGTSLGPAMTFGYLAAKHASAY